MRLDHAVEMRVDDEVLVDRVSGRSTCATCGEVYHDRTKPVPRTALHRLRRHAVHAPRRRQRRVLRTRLLAYYKQTSPLIGYYYAKGFWRRRRAEGDSRGRAGRRSRARERGARRGLTR
jgi:adenylate kinase